jgi:hypothetical protein
MGLLPSGMQIRPSIGLVEWRVDQAAPVKKGRLFPPDGLLSAES